MKKNKALKVLSSATLVAALAAPVVGTVVTPAPVHAAAASIEKIGVPVVTDATAQKLGTLKIVVPAGSMTSGDTLTIKLSDGELGSNFTTTATDDNSLSVDPGDNVGISASNFTVTKGSATGSEIKLVANTDIPYTDDIVLYVKLNDIDMTGVGAGDIKLTVSASPSSGYPTGEVVAAKVAGDDEVEVTTGSLDTSNEDFGFDLNLVEKKPGAIQSGDQLEIKLPSGYEFPSSQIVTVETVYGDSFTATVTGDEEKATVTLNRPVPVGSSAKLSSLKIKDINFSVEDEDKAKAGEIKASIDSDDFDLNNSEVVVGTYGDYGIKVTAKDPEKQIVAGKDDQELSEVTIEEIIDQTLIDGRSITLTLPEGVKWVDASNPSSSEGASLSLTEVPSATNPKQTIKFNITNSTTDKDEAELKLKNLKVAVAPDFEGDLEAEIGGTSGLTGKVKLAKVVKPITVTATEAPVVGIGRTSLTAADVTIKENVKEAFSDNTTSGDNVTLELPEGVYFDGVPTVEVTDGDLKIENVKVDSDNKRYVTFNVDSESIKPSTLKISNIKLSVYRDVPEGEITLKVKGGDLVETTGDDFWPNNTVAGQVVIAKVGTPAPTDTTANNVVFKLNSKTFTVDGKEQTMDAAPLVKWDRAFLPIRFAANALNVKDEQIIWDDKTSTATIFKGDRVITAKVGDKFLTVNGVKVPMDVPVWRNKVETNNRVMIPIRYLANALNANIEWNKETSEITIQAKK